MTEHPDLRAEQAFIDHAYERLDAMRAAAARWREEVLTLGKGGTHQAREERDVIMRTSLHRQEQLELGREALCFGRIDFGPTEGAEGGRSQGTSAGPPAERPGRSGGQSGGVEAVESFHIGRLAVSDANQEPLVVDWRAPVAEAFYRATPREPMGLVRRRHFATSGRRITGIEDEVLAGGLEGFDGFLDNADGDEEGEGGGVTGLIGTTTLLAALERGRSGAMRDIVATVQREQDEVIRAPLSGILVVQGGPGTGKTAVALHRAAYLLYTHRFPLERQGVLVVGPNGVFLRYIGQVLPSLGESGVALSTVSGLVPEVRVTGTDSPEASKLKADARMVQVVARAVSDRERPLRRDVAVPFGALELRLTAAASQAVVASVRRRPGTHNARRRQVERLVARELHTQYATRLDRMKRTGLRGQSGPPAGLGQLQFEDLQGPEGRNGSAAVHRTGSFGELHPAGQPHPADEPQPVDESAADLLAAAEQDLAQDETAGQLEVDELWDLLRVEPAVADALDRMWPVLSAEELLHDLFGAPPLVALACRGTFDAGRQQALVRPRSSSLEDVAWTADDVALLDEARVLLGPRRSARARRPEGDDDELRTYGHVVVDEAQDLSPMQLRMVARRALSGSMTVVGDIAQATGQWAPRHWDEVMLHLSAGRRPSAGRGSPGGRGRRSRRPGREVVRGADGDGGAGQDEPGPRVPGRVVELTVNYRTPEEIMRYASRVLQATAPELQPPRSARASGHEPTVRQVRREDLAGEVVRVALAEGDGVAGGTVAVVCAPTDLREIWTALETAGVRYAEASGGGLGEQVTLVGVDVVKGLEFDSVVVVEPASIIRASAQGLRALYVALTRPTRRLTVLHAEPLPPPLAT